MKLTRSRTAMIIVAMLPKFVAAQTQDTNTAAVIGPPVPCTAKEWAGGSMTFILKKLDSRTHTADVDFINLNGLLASSNPARGVRWSFQDGVLEYTRTKGSYVVVQIRVTLEETSLRGFYKNADIPVANRDNVVFDCNGDSPKRVIVR